MNTTTQHSGMGLTACVRGPLVVALVLFLLFFFYYSFTGKHLPYGAGPDYAINYDVTQFIYKNGRLPVIPQDEASLKFTSHGGTRALRPPLSYITAAGLARVVAPDAGSRELRKTFRLGSALLNALAVALACLAIGLYTRRLSIGVLSAVAIGLMPQFGFIASYLNDDSSALFAASMLIFSMVIILRLGIGWWQSLLFGLACGLVVISKSSAWPLGLIAILFVLFFARLQRRQILPIGGLALAGFVVGGGWWITFNMYHYGLDDPLQFKISKLSTEQHRRLPEDQGVGYAAQGIGFVELLIENHKNFLGETARSAVGNLDWLRLRVGPLQYGLYFAVFWIAMFYYFYRLTRYCWGNVLGRPGSAWGDRDFLFESMLFLSIVVQVLAYTWTNVHNDIQTQGRYVLPVFLSVLILFASAIAAIWNAALVRARARGVEAIRIPYSRLGHLLLGIGGLIFLYSHLHALTRYVIPFYWPAAYQLDVKKLRPLDIDDPGFVGSVKGASVSRVQGRLVFESKDNDPWLILGQRACSWLFTNSIIKVRLDADRSGVFQIYLDEGAGFSEKRSYKQPYVAGKNDLVFAVGQTDCRQIRLDPLSGPGRIKIEQIRVGELVVKRRY